jgi:hypothetical protein
VAEVARHTAVGASAHCMDTSPEAVATFAPWAPSPSPTPNSRPRRPSAEQWDLVAPTGVEVHYSSESAADRGDTASGPRLARTSRGVLGSSCPHQHHLWRHAMRWRPVPERGHLRRLLFPQLWVLRDRVRVLTQCPSASGPFRCCRDGFPRPRSGCRKAAAC